MSEREILFRGKSIRSGCWLFGDLIHHDDECQIDTSSFVQSCGSVALDDEFAIPETVGAYTGLTDKNGTKIFEGDILIYEDGDYYDPDEIIIVTWYAVGFALKFQYRNGKSCYDPEWASFVKYLEVIGNIHDNPELLKGE